MEKYTIDCFFASKVKMWIAVQAGPGSIRSVRFSKQQPCDSSMTLPVTSDLQRYFMGENVDFSSYEVDLSGFTQFRQEVLTATRQPEQWETPLGRTVCL